MADWDCSRGDCSGRICLTDCQERYHRERGTQFYCTNGHSQSFQPSENSKLKKRVDELVASVNRMQVTIGVLEDQVEHERTKWKCPFKRCWFLTHNQGGLARHLNAKHKLKPMLALPANAGPSALNVTVH